MRSKWQGLGCRVACGCILRRRHCLKANGNRTHTVTSHAHPMPLVYGNTFGIFFLNFRESSAARILYSTRLVYRSFSRVRQPHLPSLCLTNGTRTTHTDMQASGAVRTALAACSAASSLQSSVATYYSFFCVGPNPTKAVRSDLLLFDV